MFCASVATVDAAGSRDGKTGRPRLCGRPVYWAIPLDPLRCVAPFGRMHGPCATRRAVSEAVDGPELLVGRYACVVFTSWPLVPEAFSDQLDGCHRSVGIGDPHGDCCWLRRDDWRRNDYSLDGRGPSDYDFWRGRPHGPGSSRSGRGDYHGPARWTVLSGSFWVAANPDAQTDMGRNGHSGARLGLCGGRDDQQGEQYRPNHDHRDESLACHRRTLSLADTRASTP